MKSKIPENTFAHACVDQNTIGELVEALTSGPDPVDMEAWGISADEWRSQIELAIAYLTEADFLENE